jgi:hypothetical protein
LLGTDLANGRVPEDRASAIAPSGNYVWPGWSLFDQTPATLAATQGFNTAFYVRAATHNWRPVVGGAWPRFKDYYGEGSAPGSAQESWWGVDLLDIDGATFAQGLRDADTVGAEFVQIVTWNDWQEGTSIEPSYQEGFRWLLALQQHVLGVQDEAAMAARVFEYNALKHDTWTQCDAQAVSDRVNCAGADITTTETECETTLGCCWRATSTAGAPYCFTRAATPVESCVAASVRDCDAQPLDRLCLCKHAAPPPPPPPLPPPPQASSTLTVGQRMPWWIGIVGMLAGVGASFAVCVALYWLYVEFVPYERARVGPDAPKRDAALLAPLFVGKLRAAVL